MRGFDVLQDSMGDLLDVRAEKERLTRYVPMQCQTISRRAGGLRTPTSLQLMLDSPSARLCSRASCSVPYGSPSLSLMSRHSLVWLPS